MTQTPQPPVPNLAVQLAVIDQKLDVLIQQRADHEVRIRSLEQVKWVMIGLAAIVGPAATAFVNLLIKGN